MAAKQQLSLQERHPELYLQQKNIDRRTCTRVVPMEVLNLSFPRTGTMTMQTALNILGYPCYHSVAFFSKIRDCDMWNEAQDAKFFGKGQRFTRADWDQLLGDYKAVSADPPAVAFAEDLIEAYPEAKVILVERELESWFKSFDKAVIEPTWSFRMNFVADLDPFIVGPTRYCHRKWTTDWMRAKDAKEMREHARDVYREHYALVRRVTPKERLLEYRLGDGWEPLCKFLGKPVPNVPFPRVNDEEALREMLAIIARRGLWCHGSRAGLV
ncbi:hypothetical protein BJ546DRAFT_1064380 [Cryomyces antarcticus]|uniref:Sulfotransferase domain-containing protein n=1 Tax=Cryomyces antarcticus TaxID=329879 RepID=A0ABR0LZC1_9PEZI